MADKNELLNHNYDGIEEYDNDLPRWWIYLFWLTVVFGVGRIIYTHVLPGNLQEERVAVQMAELDQIRAAHAKSRPEMGDAQLLALAANVETVRKGQEVFMKNCLACHGPQGGGLIGPNLTDDHWIHGGKISNIKQTVENGVLEKGMLKWKGAIPDSEIEAVVAYIWTLHGTNPANPKAPEGQLEPRT